MTQLVISRAELRLARSPSGAERGGGVEYAAHQAIADLFGDREQRSYLFRLEHADGDRVTAIVLSACPPRALSQVASPTHRRVTSVESKPFAPTLLAGRLVDFAVRVNATRDVVVEPGDPTRTVRRDVWDAVFMKDGAPGIARVDPYCQWLSRKLVGAASVMDVALIERRLLRIRRNARAPMMTVVAADLVGTLCVEESETLLALVASGIGRARAFGCGLLLLGAPGTLTHRRSADRSGSS